MPRMTNTILLAGPHDPEEIVKTVSAASFRAEDSAAGQVGHHQRRLRFSLHREYLIETES